MDDETPKLPSPFLFWPQTLPGYYAVPRSTTILEYFRRRTARSLTHTTGERMTANLIEFVRVLDKIDRYSQE